MNYYSLSQIGFVILSILCLFFVYKGLIIGLSPEKQEVQLKVRKRFFIIVGAWTLILGLLSISGVSSQFDQIPPPFLIVLLIPLLGFFFLIRSKLFNRIVNRIPDSYLVYLQSFRIIVEIFLWLLFLDNLAPIQMTFEGRNLDILVGLTAPVAALVLFQSGKIKKWGAIIWNVLGLLLLINIVSIALLSTPTPIRVFMNEPANTIVARFPIIFLPGLLVPLAYYLHAFSIKQVLSKTK